jgi:DNA mismatch repair protein MutL
MDGEQSGKAASFAGAASPIRIAGYVSLPTLTRANRSNIDLFVNKRHIEDRGLTHAVVQAYHTFLPVGRYPVAVILIEVDPGEVDVNVHPQKIQVRFAEERRIFIAVQRAARRTLIQRLPVPTMEVGSAWSASYAEPGQPGAPATNSGWIERREHILNAGRQSSFELFVPPTFPSPVEGTETVPELARSSSGALTHSDHDQGKSMAEPPSQTAMADRGPRLPPLRVVGQVGAMYIIAEGPEGLYLIDQHAAHERILYEKLMAQRYGALNGVVARQYLLEPLTLHVGSQLAGLMAQYLTALQGIGFEIEQFGGDTFLVRAIPGVLAGQDPLRALEEIAQAMAVQRNVVGEELETRLIKMVCKRASIKAGQLLSAIEMQELVRQLEECQSPWTCPHGRPTMLQLSAGELEKAFGRT